MGLHARLGAHKDCWIRILDESLVMMVRRIHTHIHIHKRLLDPYSRWVTRHDGEDEDTYTHIHKDCWICVLDESLVMMVSPPTSHPLPSPPLPSPSILTLPPRALSLACLLYIARSLARARSLSLSLSLCLSPLPLPPFSLSVALSPLSLIHTHTDTGDRNVDRCCSTLLLILDFTSDVDADTALFLQSC